MAKNKAELQFDAKRYRAAVTSMRRAHKEGDVLRAIQFAVDACDYIDGMMQFEKRFEKRAERKSVETVDYVFKYAPLVFDRKSIERIGALLKEQKRIDKTATDDLAADFAQTVDLMWDAHRLWEAIRTIPGLRQDELKLRLGGNQERWRAIAESWEELGLIHRTPDRSSYLLSLTTRRNTPIRGKCSSCGATGKATRGTFLEDITCPKCKATVTFVILPNGLNQVG
jgi:hypothetical protein